MTDKKYALGSIGRGNRIVTSRGLKLVRADNLSREAGIVHGFSTCVGGVSPAPYESLNFSFSRDDKRENILRNFSIFCAAFELDEASLVAVNHEHGANVECVSGADFGRGIYRESLPFCDGIITNDPAVTLITLHADCGCVYLYDKKRRAIGLAHAGWKGAYRRVGQRMAEKMALEFGSDPAELIAAIGPLISFDRFEVDADIGADFEMEFGYPPIQKPGKKGKAYVDIAAALTIQLLDAGIGRENICLMDICTYERDDLFYSYRRDKTQTGAMIGYLKLV
ncbi:MAG: peptidoglycan editing factor PgeF [Clostridia bacterium]|nr:peptidoglycan editing factor PgeF [Clostridia bacterium]